MKGHVSRPSPALIVAVLALIVALAGTSYAALSLPKNSVGSKQLKKNSVTTAKIKKNAVTGAKVKDQSLSGKDIDLSTLGTVPSAATANALAPMEATHLIGAAGQPGFENGSLNFGTVAGRAHQSAGFFKDLEGVVHLQGFVRVGSGSGITSIFSLPPGYRPAPNTTIYFNAFCASESALEECEKDGGGDEEHFAPVLIAGSGVTLGEATVSGAVLTLPKAIISLEGITFRAEG